MANFVVTLDPDPVRRAQFVDGIVPRLSLVDGLLHSSCAVGDFRAVWASAPRAPVDCHSDQSTCAVIWGEAVPGPGPARLTAARLQALWDPAGPDPPAVFDGLYAAASYHQGSGLVIGADVLGLFPVYYWCDGEVLLAGSSPELFRYHPRFRPRFDPAGLVGILLTNGLVDGKTLWQGVCRLGPGHAFVLQPGSPPREVRQYAVPCSHPHFDLPLSGQARMLALAFESALGRQVPAGRRVSLFLSGGLDSRILAGFLRERGVDVVAVTFGARTDLDMQCAIPVARALQYEHRVFPVSFDRYRLAAEQMATWQHLAGGFGDPFAWTILPELRSLPSPVVAGYLMDPTLGGTGINWAYDRGAAALSFETLFSRVNALGLAPSLLHRLLRREIFGDLVQETIASLRERYEGYGALESQRTFWFNLHHRVRFFVGSGVWPMSFGAWPNFPAGDQEVLAVVTRVPAGALAERRAEIELVCQRFPELAALPVVGNSYDTTPLAAPPRALIMHGLRRRLAASRLIPGSGRRERRYYYRTYDINGPGWVAIRERADTYRRRVGDLLHLDVLEEVLPPPTARPAFEDPIIQASGLKLLSGFLLWAKDHL